MELFTITKTKLSENLASHFFRFITWLTPSPLIFKSYVISVKMQFAFLNCFETQNFRKYFLHFPKIYEVETSQKIDSLNLQHI